MLQTTQIPKFLSAVGSLESPQTTQLAAETEGTVTFLDIPEGREVEKGYLLARIDDRHARAMLEVAEARYRNAKESFDRLKSLHEATVISRQEFDDAAAGVEETDGQLDDARTELRQTAIRAPFTGELGLRQVSLGAYLSAGDRVVRLTQTRPLRLVFSLPQADLQQVAVGQNVLGVAGGCTERFTVRVNAIDPTLDPATRSVRVQATVPNEDGRLRPGMSATLGVKIGLVENALTVPQEAVVRRGTKKLVYTVGEDGAVVSNEVTLGEYFADRVQVTGGLTSGDVVVVTGQQRLRPGSIAEPRPYEPIANPNLALGSRAAAGDCDFRPRLGGG